MKTQEEKINELRRVLRTYLKFSRHYKTVDIVVENDEVTVKWGDPKKENWYQFESKTFPLADLSKQILSYKNKIERYFKNRQKTKINARKVRFSR